MHVVHVQLVCGSTRGTCRVLFHELRTHRGPFAGPGTKPAFVVHAFGLLVRRLGRYSVIPTLERNPRQQQQRHRQTIIKVCGYSVSDFTHRSIRKIYELPNAHPPKMRVHPTPKNLKSNTNSCLHPRGCLAIQRGVGHGVGFPVSNCLPASAGVQNDLAAYCLKCLLAFHAIHRNGSALFNLWVW